MPRDNVTTLVYRGKLQYAKVLGDPVDNYAKDGKEWKFDFIPNDQDGATKELKSLGVGDRLRSKEKADGEPLYDGQKFLSFKHRATKADGSPNDPIKVRTATGKPWPSEDILLGNDTVADVTFVVIDNGKGRFKGMYPRSIRVLDLVPYAKQDATPLDESDEYYEKAAEQERQLAMLAMQSQGTSTEKKSISLDDLDDDIPLD